MKIYKNPPAETWKDLCKRPQMNQVKLMSEVKDITRMVMLKGDKALINFTKRFDGVELGNILCTQDEIKESEKNVSVPLRSFLMAPLPSNSKIQVKRWRGLKIPLKTCTNNSMDNQPGQGDVLPEKLN